MTSRKFENQVSPTLAAIVAFAIVAMSAIDGTYPVRAQQLIQQTFSSPEAAAHTLFQAVERNDQEAIATILGGTTELVSSDDEADDARDREQFVEKYREMHRLAGEADGSVMLYIGAENWPFPVPLVATTRGWHFDSEAGVNEVLFRRIGENELAAIEVCHQLAAGKQERRAAVGSDPVLINGYYFRGLGPFAWIAYPAEYRSSGVMSFVVSSKDVVRQKDLGPNTSTLAGGMRAFPKTATWRTVTE
jgi:hypothetical protein